MHRRERERILGEWGVREGGTVRSQAERRALERALEGAEPGQQLEHRIRNFRPDVDKYVASLGGPLPYMRRLRAIEIETAEHEEQLGEAWRALALEHADDEHAFAREWRIVAERWNFVAVNELIDRHNRYFPVEARLPMDLRTRDFALVGGRPYRRARLDAAWVLEQFPPLLRAVAA